MNRRSIVVIVIGIFLLSMVFYYVSPSYPTGPLQVKPPVNVNPKNVSSFFNPQYVEPSTLQSMYYGLNGSSIFNFSLTHLGDTYITGTVFNNSSGQPLSGGEFYAFASPVYTEVPISPDGSYKIEVLVEGQMDLMFKVPGFKRIQKNFTLSGNTVHYNIFLDPETPERLSGYTVSSFGLLVPGVIINVSSFFYGNSTYVSSSTGHFSMSLYRDSYSITVNKTGYLPIPSPSRINLFYSEDLNITIYHILRVYDVSGYVKEKDGNFISGATVSDTNGRGTYLTNQTGYYQLQVENGPGKISALHAGYFTNTTTLWVNSSVTDHNITLTPLDPLGNGSFSCNSTAVINQLENYTSSINYNNLGNYTLQGYVTLNGTEIPLDCTPLVMDVNSFGNYFGTALRTNITGYYRVTFSYPGSYTILVNSVHYHSRLINVTISSGVNYANFSLIPLPNSTMLLHVFVRNAFDHTGIVNATVLLRDKQTGSVVEFNTTSITGEANFTIVSGNFSAYASATDYYSNETPYIYINANYTITVNLTPKDNFLLNSSGISPMVYEEDYGLPDHSPDQIGYILNSTGENGSIVAPSEHYNLTLLFSSGSVSLSYTPFVTYFRILGSIYYYSGETNSTGYGIIHNIPAGKYAMLPEMFYYNGSVINISVDASLTITLHMLAKTTYSDSVDAYNTYNMTAGIGASVPQRYLNLTDSILTMPFTAQSSSTGTLFQYSGYYGLFNFSYFNISFLPGNVSVAVRGVQETPLPLSPYEILVEGVSTESWNYSVPGYKSVDNLIGEHSGYYLVHSGSISVTFTMDRLNHDFVSSALLDASSPQAQIYFNVSSSSVVEKSILEEENITTGLWNIEFSGPLASGSIIVAGNVDANVSPLHNVSVGSTQLPFTSSSGSDYTDIYLDDYYYFTGSEVDIYITVGGPSFVPPPPPSITLTILSVNQKVV